MKSHSYAYSFCVIEILCSDYFIFVSFIFGYEWDRGLQMQVKAVVLMFTKACDLIGRGRALEGHMRDSPTPRSSFPSYVLATSMQYNG